MFLKDGAKGIKLITEIITYHTHHHTVGFVEILVFLYTNKHAVNNYSAYLFTLQHTP